MAHTSNKHFFHYNSSLLLQPPHWQKASQGHLQDDMHLPLEPANMPWEDMLLQELDWLLKDSNHIGDQCLLLIYWVVAEHIYRRKDRSKITGLAKQEYFKATVKQQGREHFFDLVEKGSQEMDKRLSHTPIKGSASMTANCIQKFWAFMSEGQTIHSLGP